MDPTTEQCKNCVTFAEPDPTSRRVTKPPCLENVHDSTYTRDYPGHKRISPPLSRKPQDALPIVTDYKTQYVTTCQERFRPWNMKTIPRYENKAPRNKWASPETPMLCSTSYKDDFAKITPLPLIHRMSRNNKKHLLTSVKLENMACGTTYKKDFGTWKVSAREIPPWAKRKERTTPPPFIAITTQTRDYATPLLELGQERVLPYRPIDGFTFTIKESPMSTTTMYSCIHDKLQHTKDVYA